LYDISYWVTAFSKSVKYLMGGDVT